MNSDAHRRNFCSFPFSSLFTLNTGEIKLCCDSKPVAKVYSNSFEGVWNSETWKEVRRSFLKDERHPACDRCWSREDKGLVSARNPSSQQLMNDCTPDGEQKTLPKRLSIRLGNQCNLKCVMCGPFNSTKWFEDADIYKEFIPDPEFTILSPQITNEDWLMQSVGQAEELFFLGGEPLLIKSHQKVLQHLLDMGRADKVTLSYFTNGMLINRELLEIWRRFKSIKLRCSIDGTGEALEYIRYGSKWSQIATNLLELDRANLPDFDFGISFVFMNLSALSLESLFQWRNETQWQNTPPVIRPDYLYEPPMFAAHLLNEADRGLAVESMDRILAGMTRHRHETDLVADMKFNLLNTVVEESDRVKFQDHLVGYLSALDRRRNTSFRSVLPLSTYMEMA